jgi:hypothetical protein
MDTVVIGLAIIAAAVGFLLWEGRPFGIGAGGPPAPNHEARRAARKADAAANRRDAASGGRWD